MRNLRRRIHVLERLPQFQSPADPLEQAKSLALQQVSDVNLELPMAVVRDQEAGQCRMLTQTESDAVLALRDLPFAA